jgi:trk system potassium uptake protein TrkA
MIKEYLVLGLGRFGTALCERLIEHGQTVMAVDYDQKIVQDAADWISNVVQLDVTDPDALGDIGAGDFDTAIVAIGTNFEASVLATIILKELGVKHVIAKALSTLHQQVLLRVGADEVIFPERKAGQDLGDRLCPRK